MSPDSQVSYRELCQEYKLVSGQNKPTLPQEAFVACVDMSTELLGM